MNATFRAPEVVGAWGHPSPARGGVRMTIARPAPGYRHILPTMDSRRAMRVSIGGWVVKSDVMPPPEKGLAIIMWAVVGWAVWIGMVRVPFLMTCWPRVPGRVSASARIPWASAAVPSCRASSSPSSPRVSFEPPAHRCP